MPKGRLMCFSVRRGDLSIIPDGGDADSCVNHATVGDGGFGLLKEEQRLACDLYHGGRRSLACDVSTRLARQLFPKSAANAASRWAPSGRTVRQTQSLQTENH